MTDEERARVCVCGHSWGMHRGRCYGMGEERNTDCTCEAFKFAAPVPEAIEEDDPTVLREIVVQEDVGVYGASYEYTTLLLCSDGMVRWNTNDEPRSERDVPREAVEL